MRGELDHPKIQDRRRKWVMTYRRKGRAVCIKDMLNLRYQEISRQRGIEP